LLDDRSRGYVGTAFGSDELWYEDGAWLLPAFCGGAALASIKVISRLSSRRVIYAAILGDLLIGVTKLSAAAWTGSSSMLSEGVHSIVDTGNGFLLLYGLHRAAARPDLEHPLGYGREIYFWSFVVAVLLFAFGAGVSLYEGVVHVFNPEPVQHISANYVVLAISAMFDGTTWWLALRHFRGERRYSELVDAIRESKDPPSFMVLFEDSAALAGNLVAFTGISLSVRFNLPVLDGIGSILIGLILGVTAWLLAKETKSLLIGEPADPGIVASIRRVAEQIEGVTHANGILTVHLAPQEILVALSLEFADELKTPDIEAKVIELERCVRLSHPQVVAVFVKPQSPEGFRETAARRFGER
jgi:cation diffusion facilitator family transporter